MVLLLHIMLCPGGVGLWFYCFTCCALGGFQRRKLTLECGGPSGKKHSFVTESSKIAQYLLNLCSAQHKFHSEMASRQLNHSAVQGGGTFNRS